MIECRHCKTRIEESLNYCPKCNAPTPTQDTNGISAPYTKRPSIAPKLFIFLITSVTILFFTYPFIARDNPDIKQMVDTIRGYYSGPLFMNDGPDTSQLKDFLLPVHFTLPEKGKLFYLTAAAGETYFFSIKIGMDKQNLGIVNLYNLENNQLIISNRAFPFATGRYANSFLAQGEELPEHSNYVKTPLVNGKNYLIEVLPKEKKDIGQEVVLSASIMQRAVSLQSLWAIGVGIIVGSYVLFYGARIVLYLVASDKMQTPAG